MLHFNPQPSSAFATAYWPAASANLASSKAATPSPLPPSPVEEGTSAAAAPEKTVETSPGARAPKGAPQLLATHTLLNGNPLYHYVLSNGHQVLIEQRQGDEVSLRTYVRVGSVDERAVLPSPLYSPSSFPSGIAHLDEHCHFLMTENYPNKNQWVKTIEGLGVQENASTSLEAVQHELLFNREDLGNMLQLHAEQVLHSKYDQQAIKQEYRNVINEASERTNSGLYEVLNKSFELAYERPAFQTLGERKDVVSSTAADLQRFKETFYTPTNMLTVLSGNVKPEAVLPLLDKEFGANPSSPNALPNTNGLQWALKPGEIRQATLSSPNFVTNSMVQFTFPAPKRANVRDRVALDVLNEYLIHSPLSPTQEALVEKGHLASAVHEEHSAYKQAGDSMVFLETTPGKEQEAATAFLNVLATARQSGVPEEALEKTKNTLLHATRSAFHNPHWVTEQVGDEALTGSLPYVTEYDKTLMSLTTADLNRVLNTYYNGDTYALVYALVGRDSAESPNQSFSSGGTGIRTATLGAAPWQGEGVRSTLGYHPEGTRLVPQNAQGWQHIQRGIQQGIQQGVQQQSEGELRVTKGGGDTASPAKLATEASKGPVVPEESKPAAAVKPEGNPGGNKG